MMLQLLIWMGLIFGFFSQPYQEQDLRPIIREYITVELAEDMLSGINLYYARGEVSVVTKGVEGFIEFFIRKASHFVEYAIIGLLIYRAMWSIKIKNPKLILLSIILGVFYAASDEWHQSFNINRTPLVEDVILDSIGVLSGSLAALAWYSNIYRKRVKNNI